MTERYLNLRMPKDRAYIIIHFFQIMLICLSMCMGLSRIEILTMGDSKMDRRVLIVPGIYLRTYNLLPYHRKSYDMMYCVPISRTIDSIRDSMTVRVRLTAYLPRYCFASLFTTVQIQSTAMA